MYLTNVENICRRFCEDKRARLAWARDSASFRQFWGGLGAEQQRRLLTERGDVLLKVWGVGRGQGRWHCTAEGDGSGEGSARGGGGQAAEWPRAGPLWRYCGVH